MDRGKFLGRQRNSRTTQLLFRKTVFIKTSLGISKLVCQYVGPYVLGNVASTIGKDFGGNMLKRLLKKFTHCFYLPEIPKLLYSQFQEHVDIFLTV
jgi:hypothetical protein